MVWLYKSNQIYFQKVHAILFVLLLADITKECYVKSRAADIFIAI